MKASCKELKFGENCVRAKPLYIPVTESPVLVALLLLTAVEMLLIEYVGDTRSICGLGSSPRGGNGNPLQYSCLGNPMDRIAWQARVHGVTKELDMT